MEIEDLSARLPVCLACLLVGPQLEETSNYRKTCSQTAPDVDVYTTRIDSGHTYRQSGSTLRFNGALHLELRDSLSPGEQSLVGNLLCQSWYEHRNISQIGYQVQRIDRTREGITLQKHDSLSAVGYRR